MIFLAARSFFTVEIVHNIIHGLADSWLLRDRAEPETSCRLMRQFLADAVQICCGICKLSHRH